MTFASCLMAKKKNENIGYCLLSKISKKHMLLFSVQSLLFIQAQIVSLTRDNFKMGHGMAICDLIVMKISINFAIGEIQLTDCTKSYVSNTCDNF